MRRLFPVFKNLPEKAITMVPDDKSRMYSGSFRKAEWYTGDWLRVRKIRENWSMPWRESKQTAAQYGLETITHRPPE